MKKVLLITGSFGNGHLQVSKNIKEAFEKYYTDEIEVIETDLFLQAHPNLTPVLKKLYLYSFSYFRDIYGYLYYAGKNHSNISAYRYFSSEYLKKLVKQAKPDIIVSTFPTPALSLLKDKKIPIVNIITDYHFHKSWLTKDAVRYYVATDETEKELMKLNVEKQRVKKFGIPIAEKFDNKIDIEEWLQDNKLVIDKKTVLLSAGAFGVSTDFSKLIGKILLKNNDTQVVVICGKNRELKNELEMNYAEQERVKILGYTENMREWMQTADVLITKAGGVTVSEALASNVPLILFNPVPGQEMENAIYFRKNGMAKISKNLEDVLDCLEELFFEDNIEKIKYSMTKNYLPHASHNICKDIMGILELNKI